MKPKKEEPQTNTIKIQTDIDETLTLNDIKNDLSKCKRMIKRTDQKIKSYQLKLKIERHLKTPSKSLFQKGLALFNLLPAHNHKV